MGLTIEQENALASAKKLKPNEILKIDAKPGTGKTFLLHQFAVHLSNSTFMYLAFGKSIAVEAEAKFKNLKNTTVSTVNGLAHSYIVKNSPLEYELKTTGYKIKEIMEILSIDYTVAKRVNSILNFFMITGVKNFDFALRNKKNKKYVELAQEFYDKQKRAEIDITHDFYLKEYQLLENKPDIPVDYILLDEAQDTNKVTFAILKDIGKGKRIILVGDENQQIYAFRGSLNVMNTVSAKYEHNLTLTFRCNQKICDIANIIIKSFKNKYVPMVSKNTTLFVGNNLTTCVITRTNSALIEYIDSKDEFKLLRDPDGIFDLPIAIFNFMTDHEERIPNGLAFLKKFKNNKELIKFAEDSDDIEMQTAINISRKYGSRLFGLKKKVKDLCKNKQPSSFYLTTAHTSKGLEFDEVIIHDDFENLYRLRKTMTPEDFEQEVNLAYVAVTRAKHFLKFKGDEPLYKKPLKL